SFPLQHGCQSAPSLDSRRLADHAMALAPGSGTGRPAHRQSAFRIVALENFRQPAPQPGSGGVDAPPTGQLGAAPATCRPGTGAGPFDHHASRPIVGAGRYISPARGTAVVDASAGNGRFVRTPAWPDISHVR